MLLLKYSVLLIMQEYYLIYYIVKIHSKSQLLIIINVMNIDLDKLYAKSKCFGSSLQQRRQTVQKIKQLNQTRLAQTNNQIKEHQNEGVPKTSKRDFKETAVQELQVRGTAAIIYVEKKEPTQKNPGVSDVDKMMFEKKFKNYLNHREQFREIAKNRRNKIINQRKAKAKLQPGQDYYNEQEVLSNSDSDYQYEDASDMLQAYKQIATGKRKKKGGVKLFHAEKIEFALRVSEFENLLIIQQSQSLISKDLLLNYLFEEPCIMMLYSINPYTLADQIADLQTNVQEMLNFEQFSQFLLIDRQPTYFQYTHQNLQQARKIGRGLKCAPIVGKWIGDQEIKQWILDIFKSVDLFGSLQVEREVLSKKLTKQAEQKRILDEEVVQIVNIGKKLSLRRLIYEIEYEQGQRQHWSFNELKDFLQHYHRLETPPKDKLIMKLIMAGKFDSSYVYVVSAEVLEIVKDVFSTTQKFAQYYVLKEKFLQRFVADSRYKRIKNLLVRSQGNRYVEKQTVEQTLVRMHSEADNYIDIEEILDFFTNRGRPNIVQYQVYVTNLQRQIKMIEEEQRLREQRLSEGQLSSSDQEYSKELKDRRVKRKKEKIASIRKGNNYKTGKKFNVTIPLNFNFDTRQKKVTIREQKVQEMLDDKKRRQDESMAQFRAKPVPMHVKQNLYERLMKDQERERQERLERFRLQIEKIMVPMPEHLTAAKHIYTDAPKEEYKFIARPMPWYCQVNLLNRINQKKLQRRQQILQALINRNNDFDLPFGVQQMLQRHDQLQEKRQMQKGTAATVSDSLTFMPKITQRVPDFPTLHQHLRIDLEIAKENKAPVQLQPFSFQNRPHKSRTTYEKPKKQHQRSMSKQRPVQEEDINIPVTMKYQAMVELRREQAEKKQKEKYQEQRANQIRKMRKQKFAPYVRAVLRKKDNELGRSREQIEQRMRQFKKGQRNKKDEYEKEMIKIYTKVFNRPLLVESTGQFGQNQMKKISRYNEEQVPDRGLQSRDQQREHHVKQRDHHAKQREQNVKERNDKEYDKKRQQVIEQLPGQYPVEKQYEDEERYDENDFQQQFMSESQGNYTN